MPGLLCDSSQSLQHGGEVVRWYESTGCQWIYDLESVKGAKLQGTTSKGPCKDHETDTESLQRVDRIDLLKPSSSSSIITLLGKWSKYIKIQVCWCWVAMYHKVNKLAWYLYRHLFNDLNLGRYRCKHVYMMMYACLNLNTEYILNWYIVYVVNEMSQGVLQVCWKGTTLHPAVHSMVSENLNVAVSHCLTDHFQQVPLRPPTPGACWLVHLPVLL